MVERGLAESRSKAQILVLAGAVFAEDKRVDKPSREFSPDIPIRLKTKGHPFVGRGGVKLAHALETFSINVKGQVWMDVGASTGGFTDCLLQGGASRVYAVDVGYGQLAWKLRQDKRVVPVERENIRYLVTDKISEKLDGIVIDVAFISLKLVFPQLNKFLKEKAYILPLVKPQFEVGKKEVGKKGVVKDPELHTRVLEEIREGGQKEGWFFVGGTSSPILGAEGNREFLLLFQKI